MNIAEMIFLIIGITLLTISMLLTGMEGFLVGMFYVGIVVLVHNVLENRIGD
jgi:hypothetical protein